MTTTVKGWVVQFLVDGQWQTDHTTDPVSRVRERVYGRDFARARLGQLRQMHRAFGHGEVIQKYRIRRATVTLTIED